MYNIIFAKIHFMWESKQKVLGIKYFKCCCFVFFEKRENEIYW